MENINFDTLVPCFGKVVVDAKDIYTDYLLNILAPLLNEGFFMLYQQAQAYNEKASEKEKKDKNFKNPGIDKLFQQLLFIFKDMSNTNIQEETKRIKNNSGCAEFFDDLIKACIKSHILVLTCNVKNSKLVKENKFHETVDINAFIHKCYIESIKFLHEVTYLFNEKNNKNSQLILNYIKLGIKDAIKSTLPMRQILEEFLNNNFDEVYDEHMKKVKDIVEETVKASVKETQKQASLLEEEKINDDNINLDRYDFDIEDFIIGRKKEDTIDMTEFNKKSAYNKESLLQSSEKPKVSEKQSDKPKVSEKQSEKKPEKISETLEKPPKNIDLNEFFSNKKSSKYDNVVLEAIQSKKDKNKEVKENKEDTETKKNTEGEDNDGIEIVRKVKDKESENRFYENGE